jgi:hypothetical protein
MMGTLKRIAETISDWMEIVQKALPKLSVHITFNTNYHNDGYERLVTPARSLGDESSNTILARASTLQEESVAELTPPRVRSANRLVLPNSDPTNPDNAAETEFIAAMSHGSESAQEFTWRDMEAGHEQNG